MVRDEEQVQCVVSWYQSWTPDQKQQLLDFLVLQAVPDTVDSLLQGVERLCVTPEHSTFQCQLRLLSHWFGQWTDSSRNRLLQLLDIADARFMPQFLLRTTP